MFKHKKLPYIIVSLIFLVVILIIFLPSFFSIKKFSQLYYSAGIGNEGVLPSAENMIPVNFNDHIYGSLKAPIKIVEYSDFQCPFCAEFHPIMKEFLQNYPNDVQWIYRHFPNDQTHPQAVAAAVASECIADLAGNRAFWQFADVLFENQESLSLTMYEEIAIELGITSADYNACLNSDVFFNKVQAHLKNAFASGGQGTPHIIIVFPDGRKHSIFGLATYEMLEQIIKQAL
ncbi:MAG: thioredoxin domain-containing protein [bacterium]|nr:thioredoxin domain-containing protein [bacterium]